MIQSIASLTTQFDVAAGTIAGQKTTERRLSDLRECFANSDDYEAALAAGDPLVYKVSSFEPSHGNGDLHYGLGVIYPGAVGNEYWLTKGHLHSWRDAAELYVGLSGEGYMLLEDEATGETKFLPLKANTTVYVPGYTAHRTINTGTEPLAYLGIYPAKAGHDYDSIKTKGFRHRVFKTESGPKLVETSIAAS